MCDPVSIGLGVLGAASVHGTVQARKDSKRAAAESRAQLDAAAGERARAETEAIQASQMEMARTRTRRRQSLLGSVVNNASGTLTSPNPDGIKKIPATPPGATSMLSRGASFLSR